MCASLSDTKSFSNLDIVKIANAFSYSHAKPINDHYFHFRIASRSDLTLGYVLPEMATFLDGDPNWLLHDSSTPKTLKMINGNDKSAVFAGIDRKKRSMRSSGRFKLLDKWRDELFPYMGQRGSCSSASSVARALSSELWCTELI